jgi:hypothetical protein
MSCLGLPDKFVFDLQDLKVGAPGGTARPTAGGFTFQV